MKKVFAIVLCLALVLSLGACAKKQEILDFLNGCEGVSAEEVQEHV